MSSLWSGLGRISYWIAWPGSWLYLRGSRRTRLLLLCDNEILVVRVWLGDGKWHLPGGGLHKREDPIIGLVRETKEETGMSLLPDSVKLLAAEEFCMHGFRYFSHYYVARLSQKPPITHENLEITDITWTPLSKITKKDCGPDVLRALQLLDSAVRL